MKRTVSPGRSLPMSLARKRVASVILKLVMATSSGPPIMMSPTQMRSQTKAVAEKKRHASVLQRVKPCLVKKSAKCFCREAGAGRSPYMAFLSFHAILPEAMPSFLKYSGGGQTKTS
eukprot:14323774-Alexandrium_andersonii.AAC.1